MISERIEIDGIPAITWGKPSEKVYIHVHGKMSRKEFAADFAAIADEKGYQTLSFDLPQHGERHGEARRCDIWNGMRDLQQILDYARGRWEHLSLFACSLGAYFSLQTYAAVPFERCLFHSPVADMEYLVRQMMLWFDVSEERLRAEGEIDTPVDALRWDYYQYILAHPVRHWDIPTCILYGGRDDLQSRGVIERFAERFGCTLTVAEECGHAFMEEGDEEIVRQWIRDHI